MATLTISRQQRDAILRECDVARDCDMDDATYWWTPRWAELCRRLVDDLVLAVRDDTYEIHSVSRSELIGWLEHTLCVAMESGAATQMELWHMCVLMVEALGHEVEGSIYDRIVCHCPECAWQHDREVAWAPVLEGATNSDAVLEAYEEMRREINRGPRQLEDEA